LQHSGHVSSPKGLLDRGASSDFALLAEVVSLQIGDGIDPSLVGEVNIFFADLDGTVASQLAEREGIAASFPKPRQARVPEAVPYEGPHS
jgi:hypothetical protein